MPATNLEGLQRMYSNYVRIGVMLTQVIAAPNRDAIDALISSADGAGIPRPKPTWSADGESFDWTGYQAMLLTNMKALKELIALESGPYEIRTLGRV
jgi:hypothetical protein